ncbi:F-box domain-containing protein [Mycena kentingensis (nom. inval.)]|nr:F-box domain-containing protein [Mycena kentingensis (nom. inval.)]
MNSTHAELRNRAVALEASIRANKELIVQQEKQLVKLQVEIDAIVYPILSLPLEITTAIFALCGPSLRMDVERIPHYLDSTFSPRLFMHVCRKWRQIALSTPSLWSDLYINLNRPLVEEELLATLKRSAAIPLDVVIFGIPHSVNHDDSPWLTLKHFGPHLAMLYRYSERVQTLELCMTASIFDDVHDFLRKDVIKFPILQRLQLPSGTFNPPTKSRMFEYAPRLVELVGGYDLNIAWARLEKFSMHRGSSVEPYECITFLKATPNLRSAIFHCRGSDVLPSSVYTHPTLEDLTVKVVGSGASFIDYLSAPALRRLEVDPSGAEGEDHLRRIHGFVERSSPPLHSLIYTNPTQNTNHTIAADDLIALFKLLPLLTWLEMRCAKRDSLVSLGAAFAIRPPLLPNLRHLTFPDLCMWQQPKTKQRAFTFKKMIVALSSAVSKRSTLVEYLSVSVQKFDENGRYGMPELPKLLDSSTYADDRLALRPLREQGIIMDVFRAVQSSEILVDI